MNHKLQLIATCLLVFIAGCGSGKTTEDLILDLESPNEDDRIRAVRVLGSRHQDATKTIPGLIESLKDKHADIRSSAAIGLGYFGTAASSALPALEQARHDRDARVREAARVAIERIRK